MLLRAIAPYAPAENCVTVRASSPEGLVVHDETCVAVRIEQPRPELAVRKAMVGPSHVPYVGELVQYELQTKNTGNTTLVTVKVLDLYNPACLKYVNDVPAPDSVDLAAGVIRWNSVGPLAPGEVKTLSVFLAAIDVCLPAVNCAEARAPVAGAPPLFARDCAEVSLPAAPEATPTATLPPGERTPTPTATRPPILTPRLTGTRVPGEATPTPTATMVLGEGRLFLPVVMRGHSASAFVQGRDLRRGGPVP